MKVKTHKTKYVECPHCGKQNDRHSGGEQKPEEGDVGICWDCKQLAVFTKDGTQRKPTPEEYKELIKDDDIRAALQAVDTSGTPSEATQKQLIGAN